LVSPPANFGAGRDEKPTRLDRTLWVAGLVALGVRVTYVATIQGAYFFQHLQTEPQSYEQWAVLIAAGDAPPPPYEQSPGYPYFLSWIGAWGPTPLVNALVQSLLGALTCVALASIAGHWLGRWAALATGMLAAFYGPLIYYGGAILPETLFVFLCTSALWITVCRAPDAGGRSPSPGLPKLRQGWLFAGVLWAAAFCVRSNVLLMLPFVAYDAYRRGRRRALVSVVAPVAVVWGGLICANYVFSGRFIPTLTGGGENLWLGNNALADGVNPFPTGALEHTVDDIRSATGDPIEANERLQALALSFLSSQPGAAASLALKKLVWTFTDAELPNAGDPTWEASHSWLFSVPGFPFSFGLLLPLALIGATLGWRKLPRPALLIGFVVTGVITCTVFFTNGRFRLVMVPPLLVLAGSGCADIIEAVQHWPPSRGRAGRGLLAACTGLAAAFNNYAEVSRYFVPQIAVNIGILARGAGHAGEAILYLTKGVKANPTDVLGRLHLASLLEEKGAPDEALRVYAEGLQLTPHDRELQLAASEFMQRHTPVSEMRPSPR